MGTATDDERTDEELLAAWRMGDLRAGATLFRRYYLPVDRFLRNKINEHDLSDLVQQVFIAILEHPNRYEGRQGASFKTYVIGIAYHTLLKHVRDDAQRRKHEQLDDVENISVIDLGQTPSQILAMQEERRRVVEVLQRLPLNLQTVIELRFWEGMKQREIAEALGWPPGTVADRLRRGLKLLRELLKNDEEDS